MVTATPRLGSNGGRRPGTIDELGGALHIPERASGRVEFEAPAGTYTVNCTLTGHERMVITLNVGYR